jgi:acyl-CoA thioester hydrolase
VTVGQPFTHQLRVRYGECDPQGVVFNAHYLAYFDISITELWRAALGSYDEMRDRGLDVVVAEAQVRFRAPAHFDEELMLEIAVARLGNTSITSSHRIRRGEEVLVEGTLRHVVVELPSLTKASIPDWLREKLSPWAVAGAEVPAGAEPGPS